MQIVELRIIQVFLSKQKEGIQLGGAHNKGISWQLGKGKSCTRQPSPAVGAEGWGIP